MSKVIYHGSEGAQDVEEIHLAKLKNIVLKIERMGPANQNWDSLGAIKAVFERRQAAWDAEHPAEARAAGR